MTTRRTNRFTGDNSGGHAVQRAMDAREANRGLPQYARGRSWCEGCQSYQSRPVLVIKGWRCDPCRAAKA